MRDMILTLLILVVAVGWFSLNGPQEPVPERNAPGWVMPGDGPGETELAVPGAGTLAVTLTRAGKPEGECAQIQAQAQPYAPAPEIVEEVAGVDLFLIGYTAGVAAVLIGMFAGWAVASLYRKITK